MKRNLVAGVTILVLAVLAGCGDNDPAQAKSVPEATTTSASASTTTGATSASETPVLPSEKTASTKIETGATGGYTDLGERQARFDAFYPTFSTKVASAIYSQHLGGASYYVADDAVPTCSNKNHEEEDGKYDNVSTELVLVCTYDRLHGVVQQFADNGKPDETLLPASVMLAGIVVSPMVDGYVVFYEGDVLPENPTLAELKQHDDEAIRLLKDAVHSYFGERYITDLGLA